MILYFSGTGNSEYVANRIHMETGDDIVNLFERIRSQDYSPLKSSDPWIVVVPTYAWRMPRLISDYLAKTPLEDCPLIYFVMTCGGDIGNAGAYLKKWCRKKGLQYIGCAQIVMPENYIAMFDTPDKGEAKKTIQAAQVSIADAIDTIRLDHHFQERTPSFRARLCSGIINAIFYPAFVHAKKFRTTDACVSCGRCADLCPLSNIRLQSGTPTWSNRCTHCMACISHCPVQAIEYGKQSVGRPRYVYPEELREYGVDEMRRS